jgi:hypothetical protein
VISEALVINNIVGTRSYPGNPYDGHTLADQLQ